MGIQGNMENSCMIVSLLLLFTNVVFAVETEEVSVTEGEPVTLYTGVEKQKDDLIVWYFGPQNTLVAQINGKADSTKINDPYLGRVKVDEQTGFLTIKNISTTDTGVYNLKLNIKNKVSYKKFSVTVYDRLPIPVIQRSESSSDSNCELLCSVSNVSRVTLSWIKGHSLLSSISVSDLSISVSLPLELEDDDKNSYSCVVNNEIRKQTQHLKISDLCTNSSFGTTCLWVVILIIAVVLLTIIALKTAMYLRKHRGGYLKANLVNTVTDETSTTKGGKIFRNQSEHAKTSPPLYPYV